MNYYDSGSSTSGPLYEPEPSRTAPVHPFRQYHAPLWRYQDVPLAPPSAPGWLPYNPLCPDGYPDIHGTPPRTPGIPGPLPAAYIPSVFTTPQALPTISYGTGRAPLEGWVVDTVSSIIRPHDDGYRVSAEVTFIRADLTDDEAFLHLTLKEQWCADLAGAHAVVEQLAQLAKPCAKQSKPTSCTIPLTGTVRDSTLPYQIIMNTTGASQ